MAQFNHRIDLTKKEFPMLTSELGRTVLIPNDRNTPTGEASNPPEILYMHNVMPTKRGFTSVGFKIIYTTPGGTANLRTVRYMNNDNFLSRKIYVAISTQSEPYFLGALPYGAFGTGWIPSAISSISGRLTTIAHVNDTSYLFRGDPTFTDVYQIQSAGADLVSLPLIGSPLGGIYGIVGASGYLIAWGDGKAVAWSSLLNPLDLTPSAITGAGTANVEGLLGPITFCLPISTGFLVYTENNIVAAIYIGNKQFPFKFVPVPGSRGCDNIEHVHFEYDTEVHYVYTSAGLMAVSSNRAKPIIPELTDFLAGNQLEDFDEGTKEFTVTATAHEQTNIFKKIRLISERYLVISYGLFEFTHAIVYDLSLERMGKIKFTHQECFEFSSEGVSAPNASRETAKESIAFMTREGQVWVVKFEPTFSPREGVLILGKYQYHRDRHLIMQKIEVDAVNATYNNFELTDKKSLDTFDLDIIPTPVAVGSSLYYYMRDSAINHTFIFIGKFVLNNIQLLFTIGGRR